MPRRAGRSRQKKYGGGKFRSERQRRAIWANAPGAAKAWAHNRSAKRKNWSGMRRSRRIRRR
jgi:hypothetical protein